MKNLFNSGKIIPEACREPVVLPQQFPACMHNPSEYIKSGSGRIPFYLVPGYRPYPDRIKNFLGRLLSMK